MTPAPEENGVAMNPCLCGADGCIQQKRLLPGFQCVRLAGLEAIASRTHPAPVGAPELPPRPKVIGGNYRPHYRKSEVDSYIAGLTSQLATAQAKYQNYRSEAIAEYERYEAQLATVRADTVRECADFGAKDGE